MLQFDVMQIAVAVHFDTVHRNCGTDARSDVVCLMRGGVHMQPQAG